MFDDNMSNAIHKIYSKKWSMFNNFTVQFIFPQAKGESGLTTVSSLFPQIPVTLFKDLGKLSRAVSSSSGNPYPDVSVLASHDVNLNIVSVTTPDITNSTIDNFIGNKWFAGNGRNELYRFSITFRDSDQMSLYRTFCALYKDNCEQYFDSTCFTVSITKDADWGGETNTSVFVFDGTIIDNIGNVSFNNTSDAQIMEFTVNFKCVNPHIN